MYADSEAGVHAIGPLRGGMPCMVLEGQAIMHVGMPCILVDERDGKPCMLIQKLACMSLTH
jgi:hypothetical protein